MPAWAEKAVGGASKYQALKAKLRKQYGSNDKKVYGTLMTIAKLARAKNKRKSTHK